MGSNTNLSKPQVWGVLYSLGPACGRGDHSSLHKCITCQSTLNLDCTVSALNKDSKTDLSKSKTEMHLKVAELEGVYFDFTQLWYLEYTNGGCLWFQNSIGNHYIHDPMEIAGSLPTLVQVRHSWLDIFCLYSSRWESLSGYLSLHKSVPPCNSALDKVWQTHLNIIWVYPENTQMADVSNFRALLATSTSILGRLGHGAVDRWEFS